MTWRARGAKQTKADRLRRGERVTVDVHNLWRMEYPGPDERAVLLLARTIAGDGVCVPWEAQVQAAEYYNEHGLADTLDEVVRRGGSLG